MAELIANGSGRVERPLRSATIIVLAGLVLGLLYNFQGLSARPGWGIAWIGRDPLATLEDMPSVTGAGFGVPSDGGYATNSDDPLGSVSAAANLPTFPDVGRPVRFDLSAVKAYLDADAAVIVDAREPAEFAESHIPGAVNLSYETASTDPALLEGLPTGGQPVIVYCGGGSCELSIKLADELFFAGHSRVAVFMGGLPEWVEAGYPVASGEGHR